MNLHNIAGAIVAAINPWTSGRYFQANGSTTAGDGKRTPTYLPALPVTVQMQALSWKDTQMLDSINLAGERRAMYVNGDWQSIARPDLRGGDKIVLADGTTWLIVQNLENWNATAGWSKVAVTRQNGA